MILIFRVCKLVKEILVKEVIDFFYFIIGFVRWISILNILLESVSVYDKLFVYIDVG